MVKLLEIIQALVKLKFTGKLEITFFEGGVRSVEKSTRDKLM